MSNTRRATGQKPDGKLNLQVLQAEAGHAPFEYIDAEGKPATLPHIGELEADQLLDLDAGKFREVLSEVLPAKQSAALMRLKGRVLQKLIDAWLAHGGVNRGE